MKEKKPEDMPEDVNSPETGKMTIEFTASRNMAWAETSITCTPQQLAVFTASIPQVVEALVKILFRSENHSPLPRVLISELPKN